MPADSYPVSTHPNEHDSEEETLKKILKILDEARDGTAPLQVTVVTTS